MPAGYAGRRFCFIHGQVGRLENTVHAVFEFIEQGNAGAQNTTVLYRFRSQSRPIFRGFNRVTKKWSSTLSLQSALIAQVWSGFSVHSIISGQHFGGWKRKVQHDGFLSSE